MLLVTSVAHKWGGRKSGSGDTSERCV